MVWLMVHLGYRLHALQSVWAVPLFSLWELGHGFSVIVLKQSLRIGRGDFLGFFDFSLMVPVPHSWSAYIALPALSGTVAILAQGTTSIRNNAIIFFAFA